MNDFQKTLSADMETELRIQKMIAKELCHLPQGKIKISRGGRSCLKQWLG